MRYLIILSAALIIISNAQAQEKKKDITDQTFGNIYFKQTLYKENKTGYLKLPAEYARAYGSFSYESLPLDRQIAEAVRLWVAGKYKCSYCIVFHANDLRAAGLDQHKVNSIMAYKESELFSSKEKAALDFAAAVSDVDYENMPLALAEAKKHFSDAEIETIISCTLLMDIWARVFAVQGKTPYYMK